MYFFEKLSKLVGNEKNFVNKEISVKGKVFRVEEVKDSFYVFITDYECSFLCQTQNKIKKGEWFRFEGILEYDSVMTSYYINVYQIKKAVPIEFYDLAVNKRVELHAHSKMSVKVNT